MKARSLARWSARLGVVALLVPGSASAAEVHVMISAGFYEVYAELGPAFERASGHRLITTRGPSMGDGVKMIVSSSAQVPPRAFGASHRLTAAPPVVETFFSLLPAKNAIHGPSGEKNGLAAPSADYSSKTA